LGSRCRRVRAGRGCRRGGRRCRVRRCACQVLVELVPLVGGDVAVFVGESELAALVEEADVVADDVFVEHGDVAAGGWDVEVTQQGGAEVDR
jgi:hypothetical protein